MTLSKTLTALAPAAAVALSLFAAACGESAGNGVAQVGSTPMTTSGVSPKPAGGPDALVAFAACMRKHGLANFPDPKADSSGYHIAYSHDEIDERSPQFQSAEQACKKLLPSFGSPSAQEQAKQLQDAFTFARCIRSHGVPTFPDPKAVSGGGIEMGEAPNSPQFEIARKACAYLLPNARGGQ
jgi:hypothetical protein